MSVTLTAPVPDGHLAYSDSGTGTGDVVVLLHGGAIDRRLWDDQVPALAEHHRVVAVDARGHGDSSTPSSPYRQCDDVAALLEHLDVPSAVLVGLSMGGATAVDTALEHPDLVRALVVSGVGTSEPDFSDPFVLSIFGRWQQAEAAQDAEAWIDAFLETAWGPHRSRADVPDDVLTRLHDMALHTVLTHSAVARDLLVPVTRTWERLPRISVPLLALDGDLDADDHLRMARRVVHDVQDGREVLVPGTAHYPNLEQPEAFSRALLDFLAALPSPVGRS